MVELGHAVGAADQHLVAAGAASDGVEPAAQGARGDGADIVDETLRLDLGEFRAHVAADGDEMRAVLVEDGAEHPIAVGALLEDGLAGRGVDGAEVVVGAAEGDQFAVGRPTHAVNGVEADGHGDDEGAFYDVPNLDFAHAGGEAAGDGEAGAIGGETHGLDALREADEASDQAGAVGVVEQHLVKTGDGEQFSVGGEIERGDGGRPLVDGRVGGVDVLDGVFRGVVDGALGDPLGDEGDFGLGERWLALRHVGLALEQGDGGDQRALGGQVRDDGFFTAVAAGEEAGEIGHHVAALIFGGLVAALAVGLENRTDLFPVADGGVEIDDL